VTMYSNPLFSVVSNMRHIPINYNTEQVELIRILFVFSRCTFNLFEIQYENKIVLKVISSNISEKETKKSIKVILLLFKH
jgi:hypothetical protein